MRPISRVASSECPPSSKKLSSMPTAASPSVSANSPHSTSSCGVRGSAPHRRHRRLRRRQRAPVELAVRRQRQPLQHHERRRHHVVRQALAKMRPQRRRIRRRRRPSPPHRPPAVARAADRRAPPRRPAPRRACRSSAASISPGSMRKPRSFTCASARPRNSSTPSAASAPGPRCGTSGSPPPRTGRPRTAPPSAPRAQIPRASPLRRRTARPPHPPAQARAAVQHVDLRVHRSDCRSGRCRDGPADRQRRRSNACDLTGRLGRPVQIDQPATPIAVESPGRSELRSTQASPPTEQPLSDATRRGRRAAPTSPVRAREGDERAATVMPDTRLQRGTGRLGSRVISGRATMHERGTRRQVRARPPIRRHRS